MCIVIAPVLCIYLRYISFLMLKKLLDDPSKSLPSFLVLLRISGFGSGLTSGSPREQAALQASEKRLPGDRTRQHGGCYKAGLVKQLQGLG